MIDKAPTKGKCENCPMAPVYKQDLEELKQLGRIQRISLEQVFDDDVALKTAQHLYAVGILNGPEDMAGARRYVANMLGRIEDKEKDLLETRRKTIELCRGALRMRSPQGAELIEATICQSDIYNDQQPGIRPATLTSTPIHQP